MLDTVCVPQHVLYSSMCYKDGEGGRLYMGGERERERERERESRVQLDAV